MRLTDVTDRRFLVTLGGAHLVDPSTVLAEMTYEHPLYTPESVAAQECLPEIGDSRIAFAGAYHGWGFHEDGARSGVEAARRLGVEWGAPSSIRRRCPRDHGVDLPHQNRTRSARTDPARIRIPKL